MQQTVQTTGTKRVLNAVAIAALGLAGAAGSFAADAPAAGKSWTLATEDTELTLTLAGNTLSIVKLRNPAQDWNWTPAPSPVPLPGVNGSEIVWINCDVTAEKK